MGAPETYRRALLEACMVIGDESLLARKLRVPTDAIVKWLLLGDRDIPTSVFLRAVDLLGESGQPAGETTAFLERLRQKYRL